MQRRFQAGGALRPGAFYIERDADQTLAAALIGGEYCNVFAPRQVGKTSLGQRTERRLLEAGCRVAFVDLSEFGTVDVTAETWFCSVADAIGCALRADALAFWTQHPHLTPAERLLRFLRAQVEDPARGPLVIICDEIDVTFSLSFRDDIFGMVRSIFNTAARDEVSARLVFCLLGVAVPLDLTTDPNRPTFNIGREITLGDLRRDQVQVFTEGLRGLGADPEALLNAVYDWTSGHPALTQYLCERLVAQGERSQDAGQRVAELVKDTLLRSTPGETRILLHIENFFEKLGTRTNRMLSLYRKVRAGKDVAVERTNAVHIGLRRLGLVSEEVRGGVAYLRTRNRIFAEVFNEAWVQRHEHKHKFTEEVRRWIDGGRRETHLLREKDVRAYEVWAKHRDDLTQEEKEFLLESKTNVETRYKRSLRVSIGVVLALALVIVFGVVKIVQLLARDPDNVLALKKQLAELINDYNAMAARPELRAAVSSKARRIGDAMHHLDDGRLSVTYQIVKHQYTAYAYMMTASAHSFNQAESAQTALHADMCISAAQKGLEIFEKAKTSQDAEAQRGHHWTRNDNGHNRMRYLSAMCQSLKGEALHEEPLRGAALQSLGMVEPDYRRMSKPMQTRELRWVCPTTDPPQVCEPEPRAPASLPSQ